LRGIVPQIHAAASELVIIGNGTPEQAGWFVRATGMTTPVYTDPLRDAYRIVAARRDLAGVLHPKVFLRTLQAWRQGFRQTGSKGDATQLGGVFIVLPDGKVPYAYRSGYAGDMPCPDDVLQALRNAVQFGSAEKA
jgi:hypothetical protein